MNWKRKGPKGCYRAKHNGRVVLLERAKAPYLNFWLLHQPDGKGGLTTDTLFAETVEDALKLAESVLSKSS
jgi:hypothetical protein